MAKGSSKAQDRVCLPRNSNKVTAAALMLPMLTTPTLTQAHNTKLLHR